MTHSARIQYQQGDRESVRQQGAGTGARIR